MDEMLDDAYRLYGERGIATLLKCLLLKRTFRPLFTARILQSLSAFPAGRLLKPPVVLLHLFFRWLAKMDFPHQTRFGRGLRIDHGWGVVVNANAELGNNVTLYHGVTLGQSDKISQDGSRATRYPVIEDDVWIGPHAIVVGVRVGRGSRIAGGAFVNRDVPAGSLIMGNPGRVVRTDVRPDVEHPVNRG